MKLSVCGKGGSGKSTVVSLLAKAARADGYRVLVVDSDESNSGLFRLLGFEQPPVPLMDLVGGKKGLQEKMGRPDILSEATLTTAQIPAPHLLEKDGVGLVSIGKILQSLEGCACPMGVLSREFLKKLVLQPDELAIVDMEAGVEHFGRGVDASLDSVLVVIEPPLESVSVGRKIHELASGMGLGNVWAVMNKVPSEEIAVKLTTALAGDGIEVIGQISLDPAVFAASLEGGLPAEGTAVREAQAVLGEILARTGMKAG
jgi:CO dehydrogenase maturation factor